MDKLRKGIDKIKDIVVDDEFKNPMMEYTELESDELDDLIANEINKNYGGDFSHKHELARQKGAYYSPNGMLYKNREALENAMNDFYGYADELPKFEKGSKGYNERLGYYKNALDFIRDYWQKQK